MGRGGSEDDSRGDGSGIEASGGGGAAVRDERGSDICDLMRARSSGAAGRPLCRSGPVSTAPLNVFIRVSRHTAQKNQQFSCRVLVKVGSSARYDTHSCKIIFFHIGADHAQNVFEIQ